ncbi:hypothetical protein VTO73DRAFT_10004 [Trametes versicolor]
MYDNEREDAQEDLLSVYFEKSATAVRHSFGRFEKDLARPTVRYVLTSFQQHPIRSTYLTTYAALSALPLLSFIAISIFVCSTLVFLALCAALLAGSAVVLFCGLWLGCTLAFLGLLAIPLTAGTLLTYLFLRFAFIVRQEGSPRTALSQWAQETKGQFIRRPLGEDNVAQPGAESAPEPVKLVVGSIVLDGSTPTREDKKADFVQSDGFLAEEAVKVEGSPQVTQGSL